MANYIEYGGQIVMQPPFKLINSLMFGFMFEGDKTKLQNSLDQRLNCVSDQSKRRYTVFTNDVMATFATTPKAISLDLQGNKLGYTVEEELVLWVLTLESVKIANVWKPNRLIWTIPYIFVNNILTAVAGREIYGIPKTLGTFSIPTSSKDTSYFRASTSGFKTFEPNTLFEDCDLFVVKQGQANAMANVQKTWQNGSDVLQSLYPLLVGEDKFLADLGIRLCCNGLKDVTNAILPSVLLKQFRSISDAKTACYQALVEAPFRINTFHKGGLLLNDYELSLEQMDSFPLTADLGIKSGQKSKVSFWLELDFTLELGKEIWKA